MREIPISKIWEDQINFGYLVEAYQAVKASAPEVSFWGTPDDQGRYWIDKLAGTDEVRKQIDAGKNAAEIKAGWQAEIEAFQEQRRPYLLYEE